MFSTNSNWRASAKRTRRSSAKRSETKPFATVTVRCVAVDGWEPFSSYDRHCPNCLVRKVKVKRVGGENEEVEQYYHRYAVALLLGPVLDVVLGIEPVLNEEALRDIDPEHEGHEGELTAGRRLIDSLHETSARSECSECHPVSVDARFQSSAAVHLSPAGAQSEA